MRDNTSWIQTYTGKQFWPLDPDANDITIEDIAHALSLKCRFTGHCVTFYSIAEHSIRGSYMVPLDDALWFLLHDAPEAYLFDAARPIKVSRPWIAEDEQRIMRCICEKFALESEPNSVREVDCRMLLTEARDIMTTPPVPWDTGGYTPFSEKIIPWSWEVAESRFIVRFRELTSDGY